MKGYAQKLLVEISSTKGEFPPFSENSILSVQIIAIYGK